MSMTKLNEGDRIRLVTFVAVTDNGNQLVSLRYAWTGPTPEHTCTPADCDYCDSEAMRILRKRAVVVSSITPIRDRQDTFTTARRRQPTPAAA